MKAYYNDVDPFVCQWVRNLIKAGLITPGDVDERPIEDVQATDLAGYDRCHFFCGVAVWDYALNQAGWGNSPVWTGSCPCQPFSCAGKQLGTADKRHLWPVWFRLIRECNPSALLGEQVAGPAALAWFDLVSADLEDAGYAVGAADLCAAGVGAPHIRQRLYWMAHAGRAPGCSEQLHESGQGLRRQPGPDDGAGVGERGIPGGLADARSGGSASRGQGFESSQDSEANLRGQASFNAREGCSSVGTLADPTPGGQRIDGGAPRDTGHAAQCEPDGGMEHAEGEQVGISGCARESRIAAGTVADADGGKPSDRELQRGRGHLQQSQNALAGFWTGADWLPCRDGKVRPVEPGSFPLAHGVAGRVGRLRAYGNSLCAPVATEFVKAAKKLLTSAAA